MTVQHPLAWHLQDTINSMFIVQFPTHTNKMMHVTVALPVTGYKLQE